MTTYDMATGGIELSPSRRSANLDLAGNDAEVEAPCDPCLYDGHRVESATYCLECEERLCQVCKVQHRKLGATRRHHLLDPGQAEAEVGQSTTESCPDHSGKNIDHICEDHQQLCCTLCISLDHQQCRTITYILDPAIISGIKSSTQFKEAKDRIRYLTNKFGELKTFKENQIQTINKENNEILNTIKQVRAKINMTLDKIESDAVVKSNAAHDKLCKDLSHEEDTYKGIVSTLHSTGDTLDRVNRSAGEAQAYITLTKTLQQIQRYDAFFSEENKNLKKKSLTFKVVEILNSFSLKSMGDVIVNSSLTESAERAQRSSSILIKRKRAVPAGGHAIRIAGDKTTCCITGSAFLDDGRLILADYSNKALKLFDANCKFIDHKSLRCRPFDVAIVSQSEVVTSLIDERAIEFLTVDTTLKVGRRVPTEESYSGITCSNHSELYASCCQNDKTGEIHVLDLQGRVLRFIGGSMASELTFTKPTYVVLNKDEKLLYVLDVGQNSVVRIDIGLLPTSKRNISAYRVQSIKLCQGLTVDNDGNVYVCCGNNSVHQVAYTGKQAQVHEILTAKDGISQPQSLCFSDKSNRLLVAEYKENCVKIFRLS